MLTTYKNISHNLLVKAIAGDASTCRAKMSFFVIILRQSHCFAE